MDNSSLTVKFYLEEKEIRPGKLCTDHYCNLVKRLENSFCLCSRNNDSRGMLMIIRWNKRDVDQILLHLTLIEQFLNESAYDNCNDDIGNE